MATLLLKSQYDGWYTTLNQIRAKHRQSNITTYTVAQGSPNLSSQMTTLQNSVTAVKNGEYHLRRASINTTIPDIAQYQKTLLSTKTSIDNMLSAMLSICHYDNDDSDDGDYSDRTDNTDNSSDRSRCSYCSDRSDRSDCQRGDDSGYGRNASY